MELLSSCIPNVYDHIHDEAIHPWKLEFFTPEVYILENNNAFW
jgi:hypothetical protein